MRQKRRLTAAEFQAVLPLLNISENRINAARGALVDGETLQAVASRYDWSRQAVGDAVSAVWHAFEKYQEAQRAQASAGALLPAGWEQVTLIAPSHLIAKFRQEIAAASPVPATSAAPIKGVSAAKAKRTTSTHKA